MCCACFEALKEDWPIVVITIIRISAISLKYSIEYKGDLNRRIKFAFHTFDSLVMTLCSHDLLIQYIESS